MRITWLGWAGVEIESEGEGATVVVDPLADAGAVFAAFGDRAAGVALPAVVAGQAGMAVAGLVTHLHRDHADAAALAAALAPGAPVLEPSTAGGDALENLALVQAEQELEASGLPRRRIEPWETHAIGPFTLTALPAVDGLGEPQVSWLVEAEGQRVLHLGDTMFHGYWWRMARRRGPFDVVLLPVNGAVVSFPHRQPASTLPVAMNPDHAVLAATLLGASLTVPIHAEGYEVPGIYEPTPGAAERFAELAQSAGVPVAIPQLGEPLTETSSRNLR